MRICSRGFPRWRSWSRIGACAVVYVRRTGTPLTRLRRKMTSLIAGHAILAWLAPTALSFALSTGIAGPSRIGHPSLSWLSVSPCSRAFDPSRIYAIHLPRVDRKMLLQLLRQGKSNELLFCRKRRRRSGEHRCAYQSR